ncbi:MAG: Lrp/AsnC family transcriptional regulator [Armatimonadota bacterium]|nr:Lrp/AsnC family transcriptional regulator [Armatimonadota bacterium]
MITRKQRAIIRAIQGGIPLCEQPFHEIARRIGISTDELIKQIEMWKRDGTIRRFGAVLDHRRAGFETNAMVVWNVPDEQVESFGCTAAQFAAVSHCYERPRFEGFNYNMYTMIHGSCRRECEETVKTISQITGISDYRVLYTTAEFKKASPVYFGDDDLTYQGEDC